MGIKFNPLTLIIFSLIIFSNYSRFVRKFECKLIINFLTEKSRTNREQIFTFFTLSTVRP